MTFNKKINIFDQTNKELAFQGFVEYFNFEKKSIISDLFYAIINSNIKCPNWWKKSYNYFYHYFNFNLEEILNFKIHNQLKLSNNDGLYCSLMVKNKTLFNANQTLLKTNDSIEKNTKNEIYFTGDSSKFYKSSIILIVYNKWWSN